MKKTLTEEEIACELVSIYFEEIVRLGVKRTLNTDSVINAYLYTLQRIKNKNKEIDSLEDIIKEEEKQIQSQLNI
ncbi:MAG: hypothetical protein N3D73_01250 [Candidatus Diapherotrites archaeon]|nr:hypothetical protein [Candidatus Diapherotrites archaeon]